MNNLIAEFLLHEKCIENAIQKGHIVCIEAIGSENWVRPKINCCFLCDECNRAASKISRELNTIDT